MPFLPLLVGREINLMEMENEKLIKRFLFGQMSEKERSGFEERFVTDADLFDEIKAVEDELIERYIRGWMAADEKALFEKHFLTTAKRCERVAFTRELIDKLSGDTADAVQLAAADAIKNKATFWEKIVAAVSIPKVAIAASFLILAGVFIGWIVATNSTDQGRDVAVNTGVDVSQTPPPKPVIIPTETPVAIVADTPETSNDSPQTPVPNPTPIKTPRPQKTAANPFIALFSGRVRSGGSSPVLDLPAGARSATVLLNLATVDYKIYQATLVDPDGITLFEGRGLTAKNKRLTLNIPADNLRSGDFVIKVYGRNDSGENESVTDFQFRVKR